MPPHTGALIFPAVIVQGCQSWQQLFRSAVLLLAISIEVFYSNSGRASSEIWDVTVMFNVQK